ncbi:MAG: AAA family ATPase [Nanoarchaeota archaeon]|nr:AAA family ATPase [Nanoarchaeota archaeon]
METSDHIERFQEFFETYKEKLHEIALNDLGSVNVDFSDITKFDPELSEELLNQPDDVLKAAELAIGNIELPNSDIRVRIINLPKTKVVKIRDIRSPHLSKLINVEGIVRQTSDVRPQVVSAVFECPSCGNNITILQLDSKFKEPSRCSCGRRGKFRLLSKVLVDAQRIVLEEAPENLDGGEQPKRLAIFLKEDLVDPKMEKRSTPGSKISVVGIVKEIAIPLSTGGQSTRYDLVMECNSVVPVEETFEDIKISKKDEKQIKDLAKSPKIYEKFIASIAPSIYGHDAVKGAVVLQLMGGVKKIRPDGTRTRGDIHILLVGDPGAGKSQILQFISKTAPKARFLSGKGASAAGMTASVVKDEFLRGWALEAGALVLANQGIACLDELDKISVEDTSALHEALEQQTVTISKANIQATLRTETTVIAAANPKFGRFDPYTPIAGQINMPPALINRFDLIFTIRDLPEKDKDSKIAQHVLDIQRDPKQLNSEISSEMIKKYVAYVKQRINPKLTKEAIEEIKSFYVGLRNMPTVGDEGGVKPIPISARQLEALVRLAEGSAKVRLSEKVERRDAKRAIAILKDCLMQVGFDYETGQIDIDRIGTGITASERGKILGVREIISELEGKVGKVIPIGDIINEAAEKGIKEDKVNESIEKLKRSGEIFEPRSGFLSRI